MPSPIRRAHLGDDRHGRAAVRALEVAVLDEAVRRAEHALQVVVGPDRRVQRRDMVGDRGPPRRDTAGSGRGDRDPSRARRAEPGGAVVPAHRGRDPRCCCSARPCSRCCGRTSLGGYEEFWHTELTLTPRRHGVRAGPAALGQRRADGAVLPQRGPGDRPRDDAGRAARGPRADRRPRLGALGGLVVPAALYLLLNAGGAGRGGVGCADLHRHRRAARRARPGRPAVPGPAAGVPARAGHRRRHRRRAGDRAVLHRRGRRRRAAARGAGCSPRCWGCASCTSGGRRCTW